MTLLTCVPCVLWVVYVNSIFGDMRVGRVILVVGITNVTNAMLVNRRINVIGGT